MLIKKTPYNFLIILFLILSAYSCQKEKNVLEIKTLHTYGDNSDNIMGDITDFDFYNNNLYILDRQQKKIFEFGISGNLIKKINLRSGKGPGDFTIGLISFKVLNDSVIALADQMLKSIQFISDNYKYLGSIKLSFDPYSIYYSDSLLYVSGNADDNIIYVFDLQGKIQRKVLPQFLMNSQPTPWFPVITFDDKGNSIYAANPYKSEIIKWNKFDRWKFTSNEDLVDPPIIVRKRGMGQYKGWMGLFVFKKYLFASTYNVEKNKKEALPPRIIVINKENGKLILQSNVTEPFFAKAYLNGEYVFKLNFEPFPSVSRIRIKIVKK